MAEYIERCTLKGALDAATMDFLEKEDNLFDRKSVLAGMSIATGIIHSIPAAEVFPAVHGKWKYHKYVEKYECTKCGHFIRSGTDRNYCPNCGAKMDQE